MKARFKHFKAIINVLILFTKTQTGKQINQSSRDRKLKLILAKELAQRRKKERWCSNSSETLNYRHYFQNSHHTNDQTLSLTLTHLLIQSTGGKSQQNFKTASFFSRHE